jgi:hypothetical protein
MPSLWPDHRESLNFCPQCSGTGRTRCPACSGSGARYETRYDYDREGRSTSRMESVPCGSCGGTGDRTCPACGGSGGTLRVSGSTVSSYDGDLDDVDVDLDEEVEDPYAGQTEGELAREMESERKSILEQIMDYRRLPSRLSDRWYDGLAALTLTDPDAEARLDALKDEVAAYNRQFPYGFSMVGDADTLEESLNLLEACISSLKFSAWRFQDRFRTG